MNRTVFAPRGMRILRRHVPVCIRPLTSGLNRNVVARADLTERELEDLNRQLSSADPQRLLQEKELEIQRLFEPGRPPPSSSDIAKLRREVTLIQAVLDARMLGDESERGGTDRGETSGGMIAAKIRSQISGMVQRVDERRTRQTEGLDTANLDDMALLEEMIRLEAENELLRAEAESLLRRQSALEAALNGYGAPDPANTPSPSSSPSSANRGVRRP